MKRIATLFWQHLMVGLLIVSMACSLAQVITDVKKYEPIVVNVLNLACAISPAAALCSTGEALLNAAYTPLINLLTTYESDLKAGTATVSEYNALNAAFSTFESQSASVFALSHVFDPTAQKNAIAVVSAAQVLLSVIEASFPGPPPVVASSFAAMTPEVAKPAPKQFAAFLPVGATFNKEWLSAWLKDYNAKVKAAKSETPGAKLRQVHMHSWEIWLLTAGRAK